MVLILSLPAAANGGCQYEPLSILSTSRYYDGGTLAVSISDSSGCLVQFCFDYRLDSQTRGRVYLSPGGASHPEARIAGSEEEQRIVELMRSVVDHRYPRLVQQEIVKKEYRKVAFTERDAWTLLVELRNWSESEDR